MKISIKHRFTEDILFEHDCENNTIKMTLEIGVRNGANLWIANLEKANLRGADLGEANLWGADLREADLREANLGGANLRGADLWEADFRGADLGGASLRGANLGGADLAVKNPPLLDHTFISEILYREAKTESQKDFARRILKQTDKCWEYFYKLAKEKKVEDWAENILSQWDEYTQKIKELKS